MLTPLPLPQLTPDESRHVERVVARVREAIAAAGGWLPFSSYMDLVLYAPGLGYYSAGARKFGESGDFITAPELTPVFARCLANSVAGVLTGIGGGDVVEYGAGTGTLAAGLLPALAALGAMPGRYRIVEISADLRARQREFLATRVPECSGRIEWLDEPPVRPWRGTVIANEVADALPIERVRVTEGRFEQLGIVIAAGGERGDASPGLAVEWRPASPAISRLFVARLGSVFEAPAPDYVTEFAPAAGAWLATAIGALDRGVAYVVDYGLPRGQYYHPSRAGGSFCGFFRHRRHEDPLLYPGLSDLTAWVDFTALAEAAIAAGFEVAGFTTQAWFLLATGLDRELEAAAEALDERGRATLSRAAATLVLPGEMGERFKVLALARGLAAPPAGFALRDLAATL